MRKSDIDLEDLFDRVRALPPEWRDRVAETMAGFVDQIPKSVRPRTNRRRGDTGAEIIDLREARSRDTGDEG